jgi:outer membrane murein-binding lipoprotein Lpp
MKRVVDIQAEIDSLNAKRKPLLSTREANRKKVKPVAKTEAECNEALGKINEEVKVLRASIPDAMRAEELLAAASDDVKYEEYMEEIEKLNGKVKNLMDQNKALKQDLAAEKKALADAQGEIKTLKALK